jgi:hypothetical protein
MTGMYVCTYIQALMMEDEDGVEDESEHERPPLDEISKNITQTAKGQAGGGSATAKGRSAVRIRERPRRLLH